MRLKRTLSAVIMAAMLSSVICTGGAVTASAVKAESVDGIDPKDFSTYTTYDGELGALYTPEATTFRVWSPTASDVKLRLYTTGSDKEEGAKMISETQMEIDKATGVWSVRVEGDQKNTYYTYLVSTVDNPDGVEVVDIYAKAAGVNGNRGMVVDLDSTDPAGWAQDTHKLVDSPTAAEVWEVHVKDFSYDPESGVSDQYRGKYMAFTELETTLNNAGSVKTCMNYLKDLGINYVQINPMYDFGSVNEASGDDTQFNWGYDPKNYNVPEGSYSTNPYDGNVRITEMKTMIKTLHENGIGVIMDVVYNHTYASQDSWFNLTVPNYYYRMKEKTDNNGKVEYDKNGDPIMVWSNGSGCGNDTASEREMFKKFMVDSVTYWAEEYHIDGFRFDLMGLHDMYTMDAVRESLDNIDTRIIMYGEGWTMDSYTDSKNWAGKKTSLCSQPKVQRVSDRIGFFNDDIRDALKGKAFDDLTSPGYVSGDIDKTGSIAASWTGHYTTSNWAVNAPGQNVVYACCHDNQTLWDRLVASEYGSAADDKYYDMRNENFVSGNKLSGAITFTSQGIPFILAGEEYGRTKYGDHNSYRSSPDVNKIDWSRTVDYADIVSYYKGLIRLRNAYPGFADSTLDTAKAIEKLDTSAGVLGYKIPNLVDKSGKTWSNVVVYFNGSLTDDAVVTLPSISGGSSTDAKQGDVDGDGVITSSDALEILRASANMVELTDDKKALADIDGDGSITSADALAVLRMSAGDSGESSGDGDTVYSVVVDKQTAGIAEIRTVSGQATVEKSSALILVPKSDYDSVDAGEKYYENEGTVVVSHIDKSTGEVLRKTTLRGVEGQAYTSAQASDLSLEYDFDSIEGNASGTITKGTTEVKYYYTPFPDGVGTVVVKYLNEKGIALAETLTMRNRAGESYTTTELGFPWYKLVSKPDNAEGVFTGDKIEVIYNYEETDDIYESTIHIKMGENTSFTPYLHVWNIYKDGNKTYGTDWPGIKLEEADENGWYSYTFENGNGYNWILNDNAGSQTADMSSAGDIWVVANGSAAKVTVYSSNPDGAADSDPDVVKGKLVVRHVDENGEDIVPASEKDRPVDADYETSAMDSEWYILDETKLPENASGKITEGTTEVVYHYTTVPTKTYTIHVKLADGADFDPYIYVWGTKDPPTWPGVKMVDEDQDGWFEYTLQTKDTYNWIVNNGDSGANNQTGNFENEEGDVWVLATAPNKVTKHATNPDKEVSGSN